MAVGAKWSEEDQVVFHDVSVVHNTTKSENEIFVEGSGRPCSHKED